MARPTLPTTRTDCTFLAVSSEAKKSVVSSPSPASLLAFGSFVAKRMASDGCDVPSPTIRTFVPTTMSLTSCVCVPVTFSRLESGAVLRFVMLSRS